MVDVIQFSVHIRLTLALARRLNVMVRSHPPDTDRRSRQQSRERLLRGRNSSESRIKYSLGRNQQAWRIVSLVGGRQSSNATAERVNDILLVQKDAECHSTKASRNSAANCDVEGPRTWARINNTQYTMYMSQGCCRDGARDSNGPIRTFYKPKTIDIRYEMYIVPPRFARDRYLPLAN